MITASKYILHYVIYYIKYEKNRTIHGCAALPLETMKEEEKQPWKDLYIIDTVSKYILHFNIYMIKNMKVQNRLWWCCPALRDHKRRKLPWEKLYQIKTASKYILHYIIYFKIWKYITGYGGAALLLETKKEENSHERSCIRWSQLLNIYYIILYII